MHWRKRRPHWDKHWLLERYTTRRQSAAEIAVAAGCTENNILYWLAKHGIPRRSVREARAAKYWGATGSANPMHGKTGALNPRYVDGSSPERQRLYVQGVGRAFLRDVLKRDHYRCRRCDAPKRGPKSLHVHHVRPWAGNPDARLDMANAITLCRPCHSWIHSKANNAGEYLDG
jgi:hypothetical protein